MSKWVLGWVLLMLQMTTITEYVSRIHSGTAKHYSPGVMERVARVRGLPIVEHMASVPDCSMIGSYVAARINGVTWRYRVTDCSAPRDRARHIRQGLVIEIDYRSARALGMVRSGRASAVVWSARGY
jgi:hypothetical protein